MAYISQYPLAQNDTYVKATSKLSTNFWAYFATDPTKSLVGTPNGQEWASNLSTTNQRFHIDLGEAKTIVRIYYENSHQEGTYIVNGVRNFTLWGSNDPDAFAELTYGVDTNWTQLTTEVSEFDIHSALDAPDPKYILITNTTAYRYYAFKFADNWTDGSADFMAVRRIELQDNAVIEIQKTITSDMKVKVIYNQKAISSDMKIVYTSQKTIASDMHINIPSNKTITSDMKVKVLDTQKNIFSDMVIVAVVNFSLISNFVTKIKSNRFIQTVLDVVLHRDNHKINTNLNTRLEVNNVLGTNLCTRTVSYTAIAPKSLNSIVLTKDGAELYDVDNSSVKIQLNFNSTPSNCTFILARRHDDLDRMLNGTSSVITNQNKIQVFDGLILLFTGYITKINAISSNDTVEITAEDIRCKINQIMVDIYYGGYNARQIVDESITSVHQSIEDALQHVLGVAGLSGTSGISYIPEPTHAVDNCGSLIDTLLNNSMTANWYTDVYENFKIQKVALGNIKTLPLSSIDSQRGIYETILNDVNLNIITSNYTPSLYVKLGKNFINTWYSWTWSNQTYDVYYNDTTGESNTTLAQTESTSHMNELRRMMNGRNQAQIFIRQKSKYVGSSVNFDNYFLQNSYGSMSVAYDCCFLGEESSDDLVPIYVGSGLPQKTLDLSQYGVKVSGVRLAVESINNVMYYGWKYDETYDYTSYALDLANFELSQNNKLLTDASITLLLDAYEYYDIVLSDLINLSNTTIANIYNGTNGFPLNISGITIDCATRIVNINCSNYGKSFYKKSANYLSNYHAENFVAWIPEYIPSED